jgi:hypothetical protein
MALCTIRWQDAARMKEGAERMMKSCEETMDVEVRTTDGDEMCVTKKSMECQQFGSVKGQIDNARQNDIHPSGNTWCDDVVSFSDSNSEHERTDRADSARAEHIIEHQTA